MGTEENETRQVFLPYCIHEAGDGYYIVLNREYKPLGVASRDWVKYEEHPSRFKFKRKPSDAQVAKLSWKPDFDRSCIYFYNDGCVPTASAADWSAYSKRLQYFASLDVVHKI